MPTDAPTGLVLFAAADPWSSLQSLCRLRATSRLEVCAIYHTPADAAAAERLRRFCARQWPDLKTILPGEAGTPLAEAVAARLRDWRRFRPEIASWCLDASGAQPTLLAGVARIAAEDPAFTIVRRDDSGLWQVLTPASGGRLAPTPLTPPPSADVTNGLLLAELLPLLSRDDIEVGWRESRPPELLTADELVALLTAGTACNWNWRQMLATVRSRPAPGGDWSFEDFVGAALTTMGVTHARVDLRLRRAAPPPSELSLDVVASHAGQLWFFDCQFRLESGEARPDGGDLRLRAGLRARQIVLRPGRWASATERLLAAAGGVELLDCDDCRTLFSRLSAILGCPLPDPLRAAERNLLRVNAARLPVFSPATPAQQFSDAMHVAAGIFDLVRGARVDAGGSAPTWTAARLAPDLWYLGGRVPQAAPTAELRQRLVDKLEKGRVSAEILFFEPSRNRLHWRALLHVEGDGVAFGKWLHRWQNLPLII